MIEQAAYCDPEIFGERMWLFFVVIKRLLFTGIAKRVAENGVNSNIKSTVRILSK